MTNVINQNRTAKELAKAAIAAGSVYQSLFAQLADELNGRTVCNNCLENGYVQCEGCYYSYGVDCECCGEHCHDYYSDYDYFRFLK